MRVIQKYILPLNFVKENSSTFDIHIDLQTEAIYIEKLFFMESVRILEDSASSVQVGILFKLCVKYDKITFF